MPWLLNEDAAMRRKLQGLTVQDGTLELPVGVRFSMPEGELADQTFPLIVIERTRAQRDPRREARGRIQLGYAPEGLAEWDDMTSPSHSPYFTENPIPYLVDYQITVMTRKQSHASALTAKLSAVEYLPVRFGYLEIPEDGTIRSMEISGGPEFHNGWDEYQKRLFQVVYLAQITSEVLGAVHVPKKVEEVITDLNDTQDPWPS